MSDEFDRRTFTVEVDCHQETGAIVAERWKNQFGQYDRPADLPAVTEYCPETGNVIYRRWHQGHIPQGPHRDGDLPAEIATDAATGVDTLLDFAKLGHLHRGSDKPAEILRRSDGTLEELGYWQFGKRHRSVADGPAVIKYDENGKVLETEYWISNQRVQPPNRSRKMDI